MALLSADAETKTVPLRKMKAVASLDLSNPSQLTMKEIIRRAEAIERAVCPNLSYVLMSVKEFFLKGFFW